jgi:hypothetical protein
MKTDIRRWATLDKAIERFQSPSDEEKEFWVELSRTTGATEHIRDKDLVRLMKLVRVFNERATHLVRPPLTSANNVEVVSKSFAWWGACSSDLWFKDDAEIEKFLAIGEIYFTPATRKAFDLMQRYVELMIDRYTDVVTERFGSPAFSNYIAIRACLGDDSPLSFWLRSWMQSAFARLEIGHRLASSFCLTDVPEDMHLDAPWEAWVLVVPDGLLGDIARVFVAGTEMKLCLTTKGAVHNLTLAEATLVRALIKTSVLALSEPDEFRKERRHRPSAKSSSKRSGPPDLEQARFLLSTDIDVDLRHVVTAILEDERLGRKHASPKVQFLVRGHAKMQAHGKGLSLRKKIWVKPFWKGPEKGRVLLRGHRKGVGSE